MNFEWEVVDFGRWKPFQQKRFEPFVLFLGVEVDLKTCELRHLHKPSASPVSINLTVSNWIFLQSSRMSIDEHWKVGYFLNVSDNKRLQLLRILFRAIWDMESSFWTNLEHFETFDSWVDAETYDFWAGFDIRLSRNLHQIVDYLTQPLWWNVFWIYKLLLFLLKFIQPGLICWLLISIRLWQSNPNLAIWISLPASCCLGRDVSWW